MQTSLKIILLLGFSLFVNTQINGQRFQWLDKIFPKSIFLGVYEVDGRNIAAVSNGPQFYSDSSTLFQLTIYDIDVTNIDSGMIVTELSNLTYTDKYMTIALEYINNLKEWIIVQYAYISDGNQRYRVLLCDKQFNIIDEQSLKIAGVPLSFYITSDSNKTIILGSIITSPLDSLFYNVLYHNTPKTLQPIQVIQTKPDLTYFLSSIEIDPKTQNLSLFYLRGLEVVDTNFNQLKTFNYDEIHTSVIGTVKIVEDKYYTHGGIRQTPNDVLSFTGIQLYDSMFHVLKSDTLGLIGKDNYPFIGKSLDYKNNEFLVGGMFDGPYNEGNFHKKIKTFYLSKYDKDLNQLWFREFGENEAYVMTGLKLLNTGDGFAYGYINDAITDIWHAYILHINADGNIISSSGSFSKQEALIKLISPSSKLIVLNENNIEANLILYNTEGIILFNDKLDSQYFECDVDNLPNGPYFYSVICDNIIVQNGKWVKID